MNRFKNLFKTFLVSAFGSKGNKAKGVNSKKQNKANLIKEWEKNGRPVPPPQLYKRLEIQKYAKDNKIKVFIETGTYEGETVDYFKNLFSKVISIELDQKLYMSAKQKFSHDKHVEIYQGDSGEILGKIIPTISEPCLFWLDGHYSEGITAKGNLNTPILKELDHIYNHQISDHVVLIDDARCFLGKDDYPTIDFLEHYIKQKNKSLKFSVKDDIIRIHK